MLQFIINCADSTNKKHNELGAASLTQHAINLRGTNELEVFLILANHFLQSTSDNGTSVYSQTSLAEVFKAHGSEHRTS